jgi:hypothetical protein
VPAGFRSHVKTDAPGVAQQKEHRRPKSGDIVIWDLEPEQRTPRYWVRTQSRGSDTQLFEGPDAWAQARASAEERAGPEGVIWKRYKDGHFEKVIKS